MPLSVWRKSTASGTAWVSITPKPCWASTPLDCIKAFSETDFTEDLRRFDVPTLIIHGDDDQIVPIDASARRTVQLVQGAILKVYPGGDHGLAATHKDQLNQDLLAFIKG